MLDPDRTLVLARSTCRALPEHFLGIDLTQFSFALPGKQGVLRLQDDRLRVELFPGSPGRAIHLTSSALNAREGVEDALATEILQGLEADLLFLEIKVR